MATGCSTYPKSVTNQEFIHSLWPALTDSEFGGMKRHYSRLLEYFDYEFATIAENKDLFALQSREEFFFLLKELNQLGSVSRAQAVKAVYQKLPKIRQSEDKVLRSLDTAVRLWLTIDITSSGIRRPGLLVWTDEQTLQDLVVSHFNELANSQAPFTPDERIPPDLTADSLVKNYGFTVSWTNNLADHLSIDWKYKIITVYEHKVHLQNSIRFRGSSLVPVEVLGEVIDTLNLLFPFQDDSTKRFLSKYKKPFYGLGLCNRPRKLELSEYRYWRGRVADLVYISKGPPVGLQQLRLEGDGRNLLQFATFWVATAVGILGLVGIGVGVVAIVYSAKQYDIAAKQYALSIAQACLDPSLKRQLPQFCS
ncbi:hypothetical protein GGR51DRAFT_511693 [Nemania sp. FL0031]|nr:hypothetical protein GGR51DRAFT_511693 [Nemania sp. FL0031]